MERCNRCTNGSERMRKSGAAQIEAGDRGGRTRMGAPLERAMTGDHLAAVLAERVMHWRVTPDRFLTGNRGWLPRWRFQPTKNPKDAFRLLEAVAPQEYSVSTH